MTRHSEPSSSQNPGVVSILQLSTESLNRLCDALELAGFLPKASGSVNKAANKAHLLDNVQHPKASKLIVFSPEGPQLDLTVFTVKELKCLAASLPVSLRGAGNKEAIVGKITDGIADIPAANHHFILRNGEGTSGTQIGTPQPDQAASSSTARRPSAGKRQPPAARMVLSATQQSSDFTTAAYPDKRASAVGLTDRSPPGASLGAADSLPVWTHQLAQPADAPMPHRNRDFVGSSMRRLFGINKPKATSSNTLQELQEQEDQIAALERAYAAPTVLNGPASSEQPQHQLQNAMDQKDHRQRAGRQRADTYIEREEGAAQTANMHAERETLQQQWQRLEQTRLMQADQWANADMVQFLKEVKHLHTKGKGQSGPQASVIVERLQFFPTGVQGYEAYEGQPDKIIIKGSSEFGGGPGFAMLIRGPEQYLTKGPGHIYIYYIKGNPHEFKVGVCKDLPERRISSGKLVGRVENQRKHNNKEYLLDESFPVPHRTLVDEVLKFRLKQWNYCHPDKGDGYTEWFRSILIDDLKTHIRDVIKVIAALYT